MGVRFYCSLNLQYLNKETKERKKVTLKLNDLYLNIPSVSTTEEVQN